LKKSNTQNQTEKRGLAGHPIGLLVLSGTQLWERLSFYGIQVIVAYYIYYEVSQGGLGLSQDVALGIVGAYGAGVYLAEPVGAWLADRVVAVRYVVVFGILLIMAGHIALALSAGISGLIAGLSLIVLGTGLLFPNIRTLVASLYEDKPLKQDAGFALFYAAIMIGALLGPLITGFLQTRFGFHVGFSAAAFGMGFGALIYWWGWKSLPKAATKIPNPLSSSAKYWVMGLIGTAVLITGIIAKRFVTLQNLPDVLLIATTLIAIAYFGVILTSNKTRPPEKKRVFAYIPIFLSGVIFWTLVLQLFTTFAVYADVRVDMTLGSLKIPPAYISSFEVIAGIIFSFLLASVWQLLREKQPSTPTKMALGLIFMATAYAFFGLLALLVSGQVSLLLVICGMVLFGAAEIIYAPLLYSITTQAAPKAFRSQMMALQGLSMAIGSSLSGYVGNLYLSISNEGVFFGISALVTAIAAILLLICLPVFKRVGLTLLETSN